MPTTIASRDAILLAIVAGDEGRPADRQGHSATSAVLYAQEIADTACAAWGHATTDGLACPRCGRTDAPTAGGEETGR